MSGIGKGALQAAITRSPALNEVSLADLSTSPAPSFPAAFAGPPLHGVPTISSPRFGPPMHRSNLPAPGAAGHIADSSAVFPESV